MKILIKSLYGTSLIVSCSDSWTVHYLKLHIYKQCGLAPQEQRLVYSGQELLDRDNIGEFGFANGSVVHMVAVKTTGGKRCQIKQSFSAPTTKSSIGRRECETSDDVPDYRLLCPGLNVEGTCMNQKCRAYGRTVWANFGFKFVEDEMNDGYQSCGFDLWDLKRDSCCPACKHRLDPKSVNSCGFYCCEYLYRGFDLSKGQIKTGGGKITMRNSFEYLGNSLDSGIWSYLVISVRPLGCK